MNDWSDISMFCIYIIIFIKNFVIYENIRIRILVEEVNNEYNLASSQLLDPDWKVFAIQLFWRADVTKVGSSPTPSLDLNNLNSKFSSV